MGQESLYSAQHLEHLQSKIADVQEELHKDSQEAVPDIGPDSYLKVSDDSMQAWLYLQEPLKEGMEYSTENILAYMKEQKIVYGIKEEEINSILLRHLYNQEVPVASGDPMKEGQNGYYEYKFSPESHKSPKILEDGSVDYTSMHMLQNVREGDVLAIYHHAVQGQDGKDVYGTLLKPAVAKELRPIRGRNISNQENPDIYVSLIDGKVEMKEDRIDIQNTHEIQGNVDLIIGKIEFFGDIVINGNVEAGVVLRAGRNIVIRGNVESAVLYAGGDVILERGMQGGQKGKISARGDVFAEFLEHCTVEAGGDVKANAIMSSSVSAGGTVTLTGNRGRIIGGYVHGMKGISAVSIGNMSEIHTIVHSGYEPKTYEDFLKLSKEEDDVSAALKDVVEKMAEIIKNHQKNPKINVTAKRESLMILNKKKDELFARLDEVRSDLAFTRELLQKGRGSIIEVNGPIYRGVIVCIENLKMPVEDMTEFMRYENKGGMIEGSVLVYK